MKRCNFCDRDRLCISIKRGTNKERICGECIAALSDRYNSQHPSKPTEPAKEEPAGAWSTATWESDT